MDAIPAARPQSGRGTTVLIAVAAVLSLAGLVMLALRTERTGTLQFGFLAWNLLLAWTPVPFAALTAGLDRIGAPAMSLVLPMLPWLALLPNAPYLVTDFVHLRPRAGVPLWADAALLGTFAVAGLAAGFVSLHIVHRVLERRFGRTAGWLCVASVVALSAVGVYIGRVLRFNSWDLLHRFDELFGLAALRLADPLGNPVLLQLVAVMLAIVAVGYALFHLVWLGVRGAGDDRVSAVD